MFTFATLLFLSQVTEWIVGTTDVVAVMITPAEVEVTVVEDKAVVVEGVSLRSEVEGVGPTSVVGPKWVSLHSNGGISRGDRVNTRFVVGLRKINRVKTIRLIRIRVVVVLG